MTDAEFLTWLEVGGNRTALVEVLTDTPVFLSTVPYTTLPTDTPANQPYLPVVAAGFAFTERLDLGGSPSMSVGAIDLHNEDGALDDWLETQVWVNRSIRVYIGDVSWARNSFKLVFDGVVAELTASSLGRLSIVLRNKLERLNTPVTDEVLGGTTPNNDRILPNCLGENHNVTPLLIDPAELEFQLHTGAIERIIEVRDNGVPVTIDENPAQGKFKLTVSPLGQITASVQGRTPYAPNISALVQVLAMNYGTPSERLTSGDLDTGNLSDFATAHPQPVGLWMGDRSNVLTACQELAASVGAQVTMNRNGLLRLVQINLPATGTLVDIGPKDYVHGSLGIRERTQVIAGVKLGYCKNWTTQQNLESGIPASHHDLYEQEWLTVTARDAAVASAYKLYADLQQQNTLLLTQADAYAEALRRLNLWKVQRTVYKLKGYAHLLFLELGQGVNLTGNRFGLDGGKSGIVIGLQHDWIAGRVEVEVLI